MSRRRKTPVGTEYTSEMDISAIAAAIKAGNGTPIESIPAPRDALEALTSCDELAPDVRLAAVRLKNSLALLIKQAISSAQIQGGGVTVDADQSNRHRPKKNGTRDVAIAAQANFDIVEQELLASAGYSSVPPAKVAYSKVAARHGVSEKNVKTIRMRDLRRTGPRG